MKINRYTFTRSSFQSPAKDLRLLVPDLLQNKTLQKLLYYPTEHCLSQPDLTQEQVESLIHRQIRTLPKVPIDDELVSYIVISFDNFQVNPNNPEHRNNTITFEIFVHYDHHNLGDFEQRPYAIAAEIDATLKNKRLSGMGVVKLMGATHIAFNENLSCFAMVYNTVHGGEDEVS